VKGDRVNEGLEKQEGYLFSIPLVGNLYPLLSWP